MGLADWTITYLGVQVDRPSTWERGVHVTMGRGSQLDPIRYGPWIRTSFLFLSLDILTPTLTRTLYDIMYDSL